MPGPTMPVNMPAATSIILEFVLMKWPEEFRRFLTVRMTRGDEYASTAAALLGFLGEKK